MLANKIRLMIDCDVRWSRSDHVVTSSVSGWTTGKIASKNVIHYIPSLVRLPCIDVDSKLPAVALCDATIDGLDAMESYVSTVTDVDVASLAAALTVSIEPNTMPDRLFDAVVTVELRRLSPDAADDDTGVSLLTGRTLGSGR